MTHRFKNWLASSPQGATVGVFDASGTVHPLASPQLISSVSQFMFDGAGSFTGVDFAIGNGTPQITATTQLTDNGSAPAGPEPIRLTPTAPARTCTAGSRGANVAADAKIGAA